MNIAKRKTELKFSLLRCCVSNKIRENLTYYSLYLIQKMDSNNKPYYSPKRLIALADGVFTVAMTIMVLELAVPVITHDSDREILLQLTSMWPKFISYILSFLVLGVYWIIHHKIFDIIKYYTSTLAWLNILFLLVVALIPFTTSLLGEYFLKATTTFAYGVQLLLMFVLGYSIFTYATSTPIILYEKVDVKDVKGVKVMGYTYFTILLVALAFSFIIPLISVIIYGLIVILFFLFSALNKDEYVMNLKTFKK